LESSWTSVCEKTDLVELDRAGRGALRPLRSSSPHGDTVVVTLLVLFPETGSLGDVALTEAVFVKLPFVVGFSVRVTVTVPPLAMVPMSHTTSRECGLGAHVPCVEVTEPSPVFFGMVSVRETPLAADGPLLVTLIVYVIG
jgi:hypothetical protein